MNNNSLGIVDAIGYPIVILKDDRDTMKIKDIIDREPHTIRISF